MITIAVAIIVFIWKLAVGAGFINALGWAALIMLIGELIANLVIWYMERKQSRVSKLLRLYGDAVVRSQRNKR